MRVQNISSNTYAQKPKRKNPEFKANIYAVTKVTCHDGNLCKPALFTMLKKFLNAAIKSEKINPKNGIGVITKAHNDGRNEFILMDTTTKLYKQLVEKNLITKEGPTDSLKVIEHVINDPETVKIPLSFKESEVCPDIQSGLNRLTMQN